MSSLAEVLRVLGIRPPSWQPFEPPKEVAERLALYEHERIVRLCAYTAAWRMRWLEHEIGERLAAKHEAALRPQRPMLVPASRARA